MFETLFESCHYFRYPGLPYNLFIPVPKLFLLIFSGGSMSLISETYEREHPLCMVAATLEITSPLAGKLLADKVVPSIPSCIV